MKYQLVIAIYVHVAVQYGYHHGCIHVCVCVCVCVCVYMCVCVYTDAYYYCVNMGKLYSCAVYAVYVCACAYAEVLPYSAIVLIIMKWKQICVCVLLMKPKMSFKAILPA